MQTLLINDHLASSNRNVIALIRQILRSTLNFRIRSLNKSAEDSFVQGKPRLKKIFTNTGEKVTEFEFKTIDKVENRS